MCSTRLLLTLFFTLATKSLGEYGETSQACTKLDSELPGRVYYPDSAAFEQSVASYAYAETRLRPDCIFGPQRVEDVTKAIRILKKYPSVEFAIRSGGHNSNKGFANTDRGITIDLAALNDVKVNKAKSSVSIGVGARWEKVYAAVERHGLSVQGGRVGSVGTGGYITGGGIGYYSPDKGWACDSTTNFDVVLANGSLVHANAHSNTDLFKALKGGSNNFGIVTRFDHNAFEQGPLTGGGMDYGNVTGEQVVDALTSFKRPQNFDKYAMLLVFFSYETHEHAFSYSAAFYHARPEKYIGSTSEEFAKIKPQTNAPLPVQNNTAGFFSKQSVFDPIQTYTHWTCIQFRVTDTILPKINALFREHALGLAEVPAYRNAKLTFSLILQSVPTVKPGNSMGFDADSHPEKDQINLLIMYSFARGEVEDALQQEINKITKVIEGIAREERALGRFVYLNYAGKDQKVLEGYGRKEVAALKKVAAKYDPEGVFQRQVRGGYKLSSVHL